MIYIPTKKYEVKLINKGEKAKLVSKTGKNVNAFVVSMTGQYDIIEVSEIEIKEDKKEDKKIEPKQ
jgi:hypothetical protein